VHLALSECMVFGGERIQVGPRFSAAVVLAASTTPSSGHQVEDEDDQRYYQQNMNQAAGDM